MQKRVVDMNTENAQTKKKYTHEELHELGIAHEQCHFNFMIIHLRS